MHSRNPYTNAPDFEALAQFYAPLSPYVHGRTIDFHNDAAQRCLTQALLKRDFGLELELPSDRLCPPVPNRLNYVLWIQDIVTELRRTLPFVLRNTTPEVRGLDIGTGASAIYPLLACSLEPAWKFVATELDETSYAYAQANIRANGLSDRIRVVKVEGGANEDGHRLEFGFDGMLGVGPRDSELQAGAGPDPATIHNHPQPNPNEREIEIQFTMCNPPFYSSAAELNDSEARKEHAAFGVCTGAPVEMITPGGEVRFVGAMVRESVYGLCGESVEDDGASGEKARKRRRVEGALPTDEHPATAREQRSSGIRWYTSMLGKMGSVVELVGVFRDLNITNYAITEFVQGQTRRWAVGWCVDGWRLSDDISRIANPNPTIQRLLPPRNTLRFDISSSSEDARACLGEVLHDVEGATVIPDGGAEFDANGYVVSVSWDTWSRGARRKRKREMEKGVGVSHAALSEDHCLPALVCAIVLRPGGGEERGKMQMDVRWLFGKERSLLESFASHVAKKLNMNLNNGG